MCSPPAYPLSPSRSRWVVTERENFYTNFLVPLIDLLRPDPPLQLGPGVITFGNRRALYRGHHAVPEREGFFHNFLVPLLDLLRPDRPLIEGQARTRPDLTGFTTSSSSHETSYHPSSDGHDTSHYSGSDAIH
jgi:hypothetical protein